MRVYYEGDVYDHEGEEFVFPGGDYDVDWERKGVIDDFDMEYVLENPGSGFRIEARVLYDYSSVEPEIDEAEVESNRETFDGIDRELFQRIWDDVRSEGSRKRM